MGEAGTRNHVWYVIPWSKIMNVRDMNSAFAVYEVDSYLSGTLLRQNICECDKSHLETSYIVQMRL